MNSAPLALFRPRKSICHSKGVAEWSPAGAVRHGQSPKGERLGKSPINLSAKLKNSPMRILSGIQPTGILHIGNYLGMMRPAIALQAQGEAFYFIADYHALTTIANPEMLRANSRR